MLKLLVILSLIFEIKTTYLVTKTESQVDKTQSFEIIIDNILFTQYCTFTIIVGNNELNYFLQQEDSFSYTVSATYNYLIALNQGIQLFFSYPKCPNQFNLSIGPYGNIHMLVNISVTTQIKTSSEEIDYSQDFEYQELQNQNIMIQTETLMTGVNNQLIIQYTPYNNIDETDQINIEFPYRDFKSQNPSYNFFSFYSLDCYAIIETVIYSDLYCTFKDNILSISNLQSTPQIIIFYVYDFINPWDTEKIEGISFKLTKYMNYIQVIYESYDLPQLQMNQPGQLIIPLITQSDNIIGHQELFKIKIQFQDFLIFDTKMILNFPEDFLTNSFQLFLSETLNQDFTYSITNNNIELFNFIKQEGYQNQIEIQIQMTNPLIVKNYNNFYIQFINEVYDVSISSNKSIILDPLIFEQFQLINKNNYIAQETQYCFTFSLSNQISLDSQIQIIFYSKVIITNLQITQLNNLNSQYVLNQNDTIITISNILDIYINDMSFCLTGIINPYYINMIDNSYDFNIILNSFIQVKNNQNQYIDLLGNEIKVINLTQNGTYTNTLENMLVFQLQLMSGLQIQDILLINFNNSNYDFNLIYENKNLISCSINNISSICDFSASQIKILSPINISSYEQINLQINNFITSRNINQDNMINIQTYHQIFPIDSISTYLNTNNVNKLKYLYLNYNKNITDQTEQFLINCQFIYKLRNTDIVKITFSQDVDCSYCQCINYECQINNQIIILTQIEEQIVNLIIFNSINFLNLTHLPTITINVSDQDNNLMYYDQTKIIYYIYEFEQINLIPQINFINISNQYNLTFIPSQKIEKYDTIILTLDIEQQIDLLNCEYYNCQMNNNNIIINVNKDIQKKQEITILIKNIFNPIQIQKNYYFTLTHQNNNNQIVQQSLSKLQQFICQYDNCQDCSSLQCNKCQFGYKKSDGQCLLDCPNQYIILNQTCIPCQTGNNCILCSSNNQKICLQCKSGYYIDQGECVQIDYYNISNSTSNIPNITNQNNSNQNSQMYQIGPLNYFQFSFIGLLFISKLIRNKLSMIITFQVFLGFTTPIFRIFSIISFILERQFIISMSIITVVMFGILRNLQFVFESKLYLEKDFIYQNKLQKNNKFFINSALIKYYDFRMILITQTNLFQLDFYNFQFKYIKEIHQIIKQAYKQTLFIENTFTFIYLIAIILNETCNNYQFEFLIYSSLEIIMNFHFYYYIFRTKK